MKNKNAAEQFTSSVASKVGGAHNGPADAFRHTLFNALNTRDVGAKTAKAFGDAHEAVSEQPDVEREMDLHNNAVGRRIGEENPDATDKEMAKLVVDAYNEGELIIGCDPTNSPDASYEYGDGVENHEEN